MIICQLIVNLLVTVQNNRRYVHGTGMAMKSFVKAISSSRKCVIRYVIPVVFIMN